MKCPQQQHPKECFEWYCLGNSQSSWVGSDSKTWTKLGNMNGLIQSSFTPNEEGSLYRDMLESTVFIQSMILSVPINIYLAPIINWAWIIMHSGLWYVRCHLLSGKLGVSYMSKSSTGFTHPSCLPRSSRHPYPWLSPPLIVNLTANLSQFSSC